MHWGLSVKNKLILLLVVVCFSITLDSATLAQNQQTLKVNYIDVGQADSILVQTPAGKNILIDAGNREDKAVVTGYLSKKRVSKVDLLIGTHLDEDHIGSMASVIQAFNIGSIYLSTTSDRTKVQRELFSIPKVKGYMTARAGTKIDLGADVKLEVFAPNGESYDNSNDYSIVLKITYKNNSFLFTGDASAESEAEMLARGYNLKADVLKVAHHGSVHSTSEQFLKAVQPKYAVISVGENKYGHPHKGTLTRLSKYLPDSSNIFRTDQLGSIIATSDGEKIDFAFERGNVKKAKVENTFGNNLFRFENKNMLYIILGILALIIVVLVIYSII